ncbi:hypothetical protein BLOT_016512 [Blomia tropicalis]|nr:hypothetical protein BLOT_016512 [Blomia tropicalis]
MESIRTIEDCIALLTKLSKNHGNSRISSHRSEIAQCVTIIENELCAKDNKIKQLEEENGLELAQNEISQLSALGKATDTQSSKQRQKPEKI